MSQVHDLHLIKRGGKLFPATATDAEVWKRVPNDVQFRVKLQVPRNPKFHRKSWCLAEIVAENWQGEYRPTSDEVMRYLKFKTDLVDYARNLDTGEDEVYPASTSFSAMDQIAYQTWFDKALKVASAVLGVPVEEIDRQVREDGVEGRCEAPDCNQKAVHRHHLIPGSAGRSRSEKLGLVINLCQKHHSLAHGPDVGEETQVYWARVFCEAIGKDYDTALAQVRGSTKLYKLKSEDEK